MRWVVEPLPLPEPPRRPTRSLLVCTTPRCGSWLLADLLEQSGVAGRPHEWFWGDTASANAAAWGTATRDEYVSAVLSVGTTSNGVFAAKLMWSAFEELLARGELEGMPSPQFVWLRRDDEVAQAVSFWKAVASGHWHPWDPPPRAAAYDEAAIAALLQEIRSHNAAWSTWFRDHHVAPLEVRYADLVEDPDGEARRVLAFVDAELPSKPLEARIARVADSVKEEWAARFRATSTVL